jgi:hypothetical protein
VMPRIGTARSGSAAIAWVVLAMWWRKGVEGADRKVAEGGHGAGCGSGVVRFRSDLSLGDGVRTVVGDRREEVAPLLVQAGRAFQGLAVDGDDPPLPPWGGPFGSGLGAVAVGQVGADRGIERVAVQTPGARPIVARDGDPRQQSRWRRIPMTARVSVPARAAHSASSSMLLAPETVAQAQTSRIADREYQRPRGDRGSGTESR